MDATLSTETDEGCRLDAQESQQGNTELFHTRLTNAICEGINAMIQAAKRKARGFHTFEGYAAMIYLVAGNYAHSYPQERDIIIDTIESDPATKGVNRGSQKINKRREP